MNAFTACYDNQVDPFIPEQWALESVMLLVENMVASQLVYRDFEPLFAKFGQIVHTRKPAEFVAKNKGVNDDVDIQNAEATDIPVPLDQHIHVSFMIRDGEETKAFKDLVSEYLTPAVQALARQVDRVVLGQYAQFLGNQASIGGLTTSNAPEAVTSVRNVQNKLNVPVENRRLVLTPDTETLFLQNPVFFTADKVGDEGTAMSEASLGRKFQYDMYMCQNMAAVARDTAGRGFSSVNGGNTLAGSTVLTVTGNSSGETVTGDWITLDGYTYHVLADNDSGSGATSITIAPPLFKSVDDTQIRRQPRATVDQTESPTGYPEGWHKEIAYDDLVAGANVAVGRFLSFGTQSHVYVITQVNGDSFVLDRPLEQGIADGLAIRFGGTGQYNLAFTRDAMALVIRPLLPPQTGAKAAVTNYKGVTIRVVITYDGVKQGHLVTLDFLAGIKVLNRDLGAVLRIPFQG